MSEELKEISGILKRIENKIEDKRFTPWSGLIDFTKIQEEERKKREEERNEEILKIQKIQTESIKKQESFNKIVAFTGVVLALIGIYTFIKDLGLINNTNFWISYIFLIFVVISIGPLIKFIWDSYFWDEKK